MNALGISHRILCDRELTHLKSPPPVCCNIPPLSNAMRCDQTSPPPPPPPRSDNTKPVVIILLRVSEYIEKKRSWPQLIVITLQHIETLSLKC